MMYALRKGNDEVSIQGDKEIKQYSQEKMEEYCIFKRVVCEDLGGFHERPR